MIYLVWAPPSEGKTYFATAEAVRIMTAKHPRRVFSNFPIVYKQQSILDRIRQKEPKIYSTYVWAEEYIHAGLNNTTIILDEAYRYFSSRKRDVDADVHSFFATNGHDGNDIYLIAQHYIRLDTIIREMASFFVFIRKTNNPFSIIGSGARDGELMPLFFTYEMYISEEDFKFRYMNEDAVWEKKRIWFNQAVADAYDTRYFRKSEKPINFKKWTDLRKDDNDFNTVVKEWSKT